MRYPTMGEDAIRPGLGYMLGATVLFTYLLMIMGTFVTSTGSGLACPDWPLCYGSVKPPLEMSIWFEWGHRLLGAITGTLIMLSTFFVWRRYRGLPRALTFAVLTLLAFAVALGGITVLLEAPLLDGFTHVAVISSHLLIATLVLICLVFTLRYVLKSKAATQKGHYKLLFGVVYLQVVLGILVRYSGATLACPDFPLCNGELIPALAGYPVMLHFIHRAGAAIVFLTTAAMLIRALRDGTGIGGFAAAFALVLFQALFGALIVVSGMFLPFIIMHGATGFMLLGYLAYQSMPHFFKEASEGRAT